MGLDIISSYPTGQNKITLFLHHDSELDKMSYPLSGNELDNSCYLILTSALFHDLIQKTKSPEFFGDNCRISSIDY